jgi:vacuolar-type H+-ATPase subunit H
MFVKGADEVGDKIIDPTKEMTEKERNKAIKEEKKYREAMTNDYNATFQQIMNH